MIDAREDPARVGTELSASRARSARRLAELKAGGVRARPPAEGALAALPSMPPSPPPGELAVRCGAPSAPQAAPAAVEPPPGRACLAAFAAALLLAAALLWCRARRRRAAGTSDSRT